MKKKKKLLIHEPVVGQKRIERFCSDGKEIKLIKEDEMSAEQIRERRKRFFISDQDCIIITKVKSNGS